MSSLINAKEVASIKFELDVQKEDYRGIKIDPPMLNLKITTTEVNTDNENNLIIPMLSMAHLMETYNRLIQNYYKSRNLDPRYGHI
jgi:hypothetical protein